MHCLITLKCSLNVSITSGHNVLVKKLSLPLSRQPVGCALYPSVASTTFSITRCCPNPNSATKTLSQFNPIRHRTSKRAEKVCNSMFFAVKISFLLLSCTFIKQVLTLVYWINHLFHICASRLSEPTSHLSFLHVSGFVLRKSTSEGVVQMLQRDCRFCSKESKHVWMQNSACA